MSLYFERSQKLISECGPDARYLLEIIVAALGAWQNISVKSLAEHLRLDETVVSVALNELVVAGVLQRLVAPRDGRVGRGKVTYTLCRGSEHRLADRAYPQHAELLHTLFSGADMAFAVLGREVSRAGKPGEPGVFSEFDEEVAARPKKGKHRLPGGRGRLSIRNRLLFAVLISRSDRFGEVQIGLPELAQLTGMQPEQVKTRLVRLMMLGLIRRHISGLSSKVFASGRIESTYFLNIDALAPQGAIAVHLAYDRNDRTFSHADVLHSECARAIKGRLDGLKSPASLLRLLAGQQRRVFFLFQHLLYRYASHLLSRHWQKLALDKPIEDAELKALIERDFIKAPRPESASEIGPEPEAEACGQAASDLKDGAGGEAGQTCACIYVLAMEIAREYRVRFGQANGVDLEAADIRILPAMNDLGYRAITILFQPVLVGLGHFSVLHEVKRGVVENWPEANETELALQNRMDFGLVSLPRKVRRALGLQ
ncbi:TPA: winged helix-turn-helix transcriptional regulator [Pseudomonas aeruginosa]|uniref:MarR family winged helix-turn-helix transcriptional regulator n=1 Tax=Pseudomonas aeruginosa TaxID=287 RepID=UPI001888E4E7|nr:MarR family winged helix-turn-helix transcriptional regulator [Pseudomonas aeruginosa]MBF1867496.1 winged helix-turn-helix transcriptional regulator [Pseudomonas aeruginosa]HBP5443755.1 MarR family transcriptional regulator [Pseudomonas aeruginosa]HCF9849673.1 winged helix-turn-helix transcriptional regulator [Pseudomonas aeruginosa]HEJ5133701.1 winged helix-turn-helix transcriptional regulator [Pseudomonas aeruginosa]